LKEAAAGGAQVAGALLLGKKFQSRRNIRPGHACHIFTGRSIDLSFLVAFMMMTVMKLARRSGDVRSRALHRAEGERFWRTHRFVADNNSGSRLLE